LKIKIKCLCFCKSYCWENSFCIVICFVFVSFY